MDKITIRNSKTNESLIIDCETVPGYILKSVDWGTIEATYNSSKYVNQIGESQSDPSLGTRSITIEGWAVTQENPLIMKSLKSKLNRFINPTENFELLYKNYTLNIAFDSTVSYSKEYSENNDTLCKFQLTGIAFDPVFRYKQENRSIFAVTTPIFHFPLVISQELPEKGLVFGKRSDSLIITVANNGDLPAGMRIVFRAKGSLTNPSIINIFTREKLQLQKELSFGEEVEIYTGIGNKKVQGKLKSDTDWKNYFRYFSLSNSWLQLQPGINMFRYDAESGLNNLEVIVYFKPEFLEVEE